MINNVNTMRCALDDRVSGSRMRTHAQAVTMSFPPVSDRTLSKAVELAFVHTCSSLLVGKETLFRRSFFRDLAFLANSLSFPK